MLPDTRFGTRSHHWMSADVGPAYSERTIATKESISNNASLANNAAIIQSQHKPLTVDGNETSLRAEQVNHVPFFKVFSWRWLASNRETRVTALNGHIRRVASSGNPWHNRRIYPSNLEADQWLAERHGAGRSNLPSLPGLARLNR